MKACWSQDAQRAIAELNDSDLMGRLIFVREDREHQGGKHHSNLLREYQFVSYSKPSMAFRALNTICPHAHSLIRTPCCHQAKVVAAAVLARAAAHMVAADFAAVAVDAAVVVAAAAAAEGLVVVAAAAAAAAAAATRTAGKFTSATSRGPSPGRCAWSGSAQERQFEFTLFYYTITLYVMIRQFEHDII